MSLPFDIRGCTSCTNTVNLVCRVTHFQHLSIRVHTIISEFVFFPKLDLPKPPFLHFQPYGEYKFKRPMCYMLACPRFLKLAS